MTSERRVVSSDFVSSLVEISLAPAVDIADDKCSICKSEFVGSLLSRIFEDFNQKVARDFPGFQDEIVVFGICGGYDSVVVTSNDGLLETQWRISYSKISNTGTCFVSFSDTICNPFDVPIKFYILKGQENSWGAMALSTKRIKEEVTRRFRNRIYALNLFLWYELRKISKNNRLSVTILCDRAKNPSFNKVQDEKA